ncbi:MAG TPA: glycosyltransferase family 39 protein [Planctomycetota bacterium]|nr:glycosyltransferase family 39 protein [Planctomycetota bacterium]
MFIGIIEFAISALCLGYFSRALARHSLESALDRSLGSAIIAAGMIVGAAEFLSLSGQLGNPHAWVSLHGLLFLIGLRFIRRDPAVNIRAVSGIPFALRWMGLLYIGIFLVAVCTPANTWDSLSYHLARVAYYLQQGHLGHFQTNDIRQVSFGCNAELLMLWSMVFLRSDVLAPLVQFSAAVFCGAAVYGIARSLGLRRGYAVICVPLLLGAPQIALQSSSTQNDLTTAALVAGAVYFLIAWAQSGMSAHGFIAAVALGLAAGTKPTSWLFAPGVALFVLFLAARRKTLTTPNFLRLAAACAMALSVFCMPHLLRNLQATGHLLAQHPSVQAVDPSLGTTAATALRYGCELLDFNSLPPPLAEAGGRWKKTLGTWLVHDLKGINPERATYWHAPYRFEPQPLHEDRAWFGLTGALWVAFGVAGVFCAARRCETQWLAFALVPAGWCLLHFVFLRWQMFGSRFFCATMLLMLPLGIYGMQKMLAGLPRMWKRVWWHALVGLSLSGAACVLLYNNSKPLLESPSGTSVFNLSRQQQRYRARPQYVPLVQSLSQLPPARIGFCADADQWDYAIFGESLQHHVIRYDHNIDWKRVFDVDRCDLVILCAEWDDVGWLTLDTPNYRKPYSIPASYQVLLLASSWYIVRPPVSEQAPGSLPAAPDRAPANGDN